MHNLSDENLIAELGRGRTAALDELYARYAREMYAFCRHAAHNPAAQEIEDLIQDIFLRLIKAADTFNPEKASFRTWLYRIARNRCIDFNRRNARVSFIPFFKDHKTEDRAETPSREETLPDPSGHTETSVVKKAIHEAIKDCIAALQNEEERQALLLYYFSGKVYREIADIIGKSLSTAKNRIHQAQENVKACLESKEIDSWDG